MFLARFVLPALLLLAGPAQAQTAPADTARFYKHHLGLTASPVLDHFFTANRSLPVGLLYKRQTAPNRALRFRLVGYYSRRDTLVTDMFSFPATKSAGPDIRNWEVNAFVGYEWQHSLGRRFRWNYGLEVGGGYDRQDRSYALEFSYTLDPTRKLITRVGSGYVRRWTVQGRAFAAVSYALNPHLSMFAESAIVLLYANQERTEHFTELLPGGFPSAQGLPTFRNNQYFNAYFKPITFLGIAASF